MSAVSSLHRVKLIVCGLGNVGGAFINQIRAPAKQKLDAEKYGIAPEIFALVDSSGGLLRQQASASVDEAKGTAAADFVTDALKWKSGDASAAGGRRSLHDFYVAQASGQGSSMRFVPKLEDCVKLAAASVAEDRAAGKSSSFVMIDISATDATCSALVAALQQGGGVVLANKKPLSVDQQVFDALTHPSAAGRVGYESTVGAGTPFIATLQRLVAGGDDVSTIQGSFSGTLGFLMTELEAGTSFSKAVRKAFDLGYTEPDPRDDLGGTDVQRKALILARTLGLKLDMKDVAVEPLFPAELSADKVPSPQEFLSKIGALCDNDFAKKSSEAKADGGKVLRYVATVTSSGCSVGLRALPAQSPIGSLAGTENMAEFRTRIYAKSPLVVRGAGAGAEVTAAGVIGDLVSVSLVLKAAAAAAASSSSSSK